MCRVDPIAISFSGDMQLYFSVLLFLICHSSRRNEYATSCELQNPTISVLESDNQSRKSTRRRLSCLVSVVGILRINEALFMQSIHPQSFPVKLQTTATAIQHSPTSLLGIYCMYDKYHNILQR